MKRSENESICRKLHLKDFLPFEVQRLVRYQLLFQELAKNITGTNFINTIFSILICLEISFDWMSFLKIIGTSSANDSFSCMYFTNLLSTRMNKGWATILVFKVRFTRFKESIWKTLCKIFGSGFKVCEKFQLRGSIQFNTFYAEFKSSFRFELACTVQNIFQLYWTS